MKVWIICPTQQSKLVGCPLFLGMQTVFLPGGILCSSAVTDKILHLQHQDPRQLHVASISPASVLSDSLRNCRFLSFPLEASSHHPPEQAGLEASKMYFACDTFAFGYFQADLLGCLGAGRSPLVKDFQFICSVLNQVCKAGQESNSYKLCGCLTGLVSSL